ncbi:MAG: hydrophobe/amphiphile efflux-3 (HAE3) family transporter [Euryarchaeota archaeon]|nr:hydrophobe/amphiphile efflux-3 (HAE3) family transporter [Euryarchaeota archaeon]
MTAIMDRIGRSIIYHPFAIAGAIITILLISLYGATFIQMETGTDTFIEMSSPSGILLDKYNEEFGTNTIILIIEADDTETPSVLNYIEKLSDDISNEAYISGVSSAADIIKSYSGGQIPQNRAETDEIIQGLPDGIKNRFFKSKMMSLIFVTTEDYSDTSVRDHILQNLDSLILLSGTPPGVTVSVSGDPAYDKQMGEAMGKEMGTLMATTMFLMIATLAILFGYVRYRFLPILIVFGGILMTFGIMGWFGFKISIPVIGAFPVIIGLGIDYAVQFQSRLNEEIQDKNLKEAILSMLRHSGPVHFITMCTTALGFVALLSAPIPMIKDFGIACLIGVVSCFFLAILAVPVFFRITGYKKSRSSISGLSADNNKNTGFIDHYDRFLGKTAVIIAKNPVKVILIFGLIAIGGFQFDSSIPINTDKTSYVPEDMPAKVNLEKVSSTIGATSTTPVIIMGSDLTDPKIIQWIYEFGEYETEKHDTINSHESISTLIRRYNNQKLPQTKEETTRILSEIPEDTRNKYLSGGITAAIEFETLNMDMAELNSLIGQIRKDITWFNPPPGITAGPTGDSMVFGDLYNKISSSKTEMTIIGIILIIAFLILVYRRFESLTPIIPVLMIIGWNDLIMYTFNIAYTPLTACLGAMTIGLAMDYTILIMERCREELEKGAELYEAIGTGVTKIGAAITISGLTTLFGFSSMLFSSFNIVSAFGQTTVITIFFSLVGGIVVMPAIVALVFKNKNFNGGSENPVPGP